MLGQHPEAYGVPELNLFIVDTLREFVEELRGYRQIQMHGLIRLVSHLYAGEQTLLSVDMARCWILTRLDRSTADVYRELCRRVAPLRIIDKSPVYSLKPEYLQRLREAFPAAYYLHLVRHPRTQGESIMKVAKGLMAILANSIDYTTDPPVIDPQISWYAIQSNIINFLAEIPDTHQLQLRGEDALNDPEHSLRNICRWLGLSDAPLAIKAMLHPEDSPFSSLGPLGAHLGNDINFLRAPAPRLGQIPPTTLEGPLSWRKDGKGFGGKVKKLAQWIGYR